VLIQVQLQPPEDEITQHSGLGVFIPHTELLPDSARVSHNIFCARETSMNQKNNPYDNGKPLFSQKTLAKHWGVSVRTINRLIKSGDLSARRIGNQWRIEPQDAEVYARRQG
jgi:excisionase family DNA binding protein